MMTRTAFILLVSVLPAFAGVVPRSQPSSTPQCYACPSKDNGNFALGSSHVEGNSINCVYPRSASDHSNSSFCRYSTSSGQLTQDHDASGCPSSATTVACAAKKRNAKFEKAKRRVEARAAAGGSSRESKRAMMIDLD
ncbi:hypothetical protein JAAARDRAFT_477108 [Jaapia argillacea MUCL 33604]|uniref:Uncharacterized protein n=1 Tax=Jaapia argillacea MUCL 33604 TaxID=933084 RepID=A0A067PMF4_9AGAM|nr:hypothetical protein JAAARDRAFT_477108 [Jaapia argillacea MUCL 33604]